MVARPAAESPIADRAGDGILLVDKLEGPTSHDVVAIARRAVGTKSVGHTGTLDPIATGLLVLLVGRATRLLPYVVGEPKVYDATIAFGTETTTDDRTGTVVRSADPPDPDKVRPAILPLTGRIEQVPPAYSAKQQGGVRAYDAARRGDALDLAPSQVYVESWIILELDAGVLRARITCGSGTYIRALARDLGRELGSAAHLSELRRVSSGPFSVDGAATVDDIVAGRFTILPLRAAVGHLPVRILDPEELKLVGHGRALPAATDDASSRVAALTPDGVLAAILDLEDGQLHPRVVLEAN
jgi:tRNA pseudouridine55 synthase